VNNPEQACKVIHRALRHGLHRVSNSRMSLTGLHSANSIPIEKRYLESKTSWVGFTQPGN
jgi:hypothetical protein